MLYKVYLPTEIYQVMLTHAYSTENEEVIGMLIGYWEKVENSNPFVPSKVVAHIRSLSLLSRSDKRKDRVEIAPEDLHMAAVEAEAYGQKTGQPMVVVGWYHSHPHITVFPSHVDLNTQYTQQFMDDRFFGIIISCFDSSSHHAEKTSITCFQSLSSLQNNHKRVNIPLEIIPCSVNDVYSLYSRLPTLIHEEHQREYHAAVDSIIYDLKASKQLNEKNQNLPGSMTQLYNTSVYGQSISSVIDTIIIPLAHIMDSKSKQMQTEMDALTAYKKKLLDKPKEKPKETSLIDL
ncbi:JAB1/Mov34/MPN/PAD-1 ubiquitin protease-domain-containing protein [Pilobolus umbonatus]|nr:JAB1/Mov34/MPN/PAD-1 ubiquitin protease-domain-containing protein [Pilobolus umbonatus]